MPDSRRVGSPPTAARPFLKWAGGKRQLLPEIRRFYPDDFGTYYEPFVGSGAVFFDLYARGLLAGGQTVLLDGSADLVGCYLMVRDRIDEVLRHLARLDAGHREDPKGHYYRVRDERFNPERQRILNGSGRASYTPALAAMLIYLNRTGFNGLFRLNSRGGFNVPAGRYANPRICDKAGLERASAALAGTRTEICVAPFESVLDRARRGDFLYFDPPYAPVSRTAGFTSYTADAFSPADQGRLQQVAIELARRGCHVLLSNSTAPQIAELYDGNADAARAGLNAFRVPARRAINSKPSARGNVREYLISNIPQRAL